VPDPDSAPLFAGPRLHCETGLAPGAHVELPERAARHVAALRLRVGDALTLFAGDGGEWRATLGAIGKRGVRVAVHERREVNRESPLEITLAQGICAADRMDLVLQKATELGVARVRPLLTARAIVRLSQERQERRDGGQRRGLGAQDARPEAHGREARELREVALVVGEAALGADQDGDRRAHVQGAQRGVGEGREQEARARRRGLAEEIAQAGDRVCGIEDHRRGDHGPRERPAARLVDATEETERTAKRHGHPSSKARTASAARAFVSQRNSAASRA
jgi:hypothetical protein